MKKRIISIILALTVAVSLMSTAALAVSPGLGNFKTARAYPATKFTDVTPSHWFYGDVKRSYELNLIDGRTQSAYVPYANLTLAEAVKLAACLHSIYYTGEVTLTNGDPWYRPYADYALEYGIIEKDYPNYFANATRAQFAEIFGNALPNDALKKINEVPNGSIPDVSLSSSYADEVYKLYRAGILTGNDSEGTFTPNANIDRSQMAAITARMADESLRKTVSLSDDSMSAEEVFEECAPAVFHIITYDRSGSPLKSGSGFFVSADGKAVTNHHVIEGAYSAIIRTHDGKEHKVSGAYDWDKNLDLALLKIEGGGYPYLEKGDSSAVKNGAAIYAIGSPLGLENSISQGIISSKSREIGGNEYIQISAPISRGSSGGALIDTSGKVIGVTTATVEGGQSLNLAVPINKLGALTADKVYSLGEVNGGSAIPELKVTVSSSKLTMACGTQQTVYVTVSNSDFDRLFCESSNENIVKCGWKDWVTDTKAILVVQAYRPGTVTLTVSALDNNRNPLAEEEIQVTVN